MVGIAAKGPAARAEFKTGDVVLAVKGENVTTLAASTARSGRSGSAGVEVPLTLYRDGVTFDVRGQFIRPRQIPQGAETALTSLSWPGNRFRPLAAAEFTRPSTSSFRYRC